MKIVTCAGYLLLTPADVTYVGYLLLTSIVSRRNPMPAFEGTRKRTLICIAQQKGYFSDTQAVIGKIAQGHLRTNLL